MARAAFAPENHCKTLHANMLLMPQFHGFFDVLWIFGSLGCACNRIVMFQELVEGHLGVDRHEHNFDRLLESEQFAVSLVPLLLAFLPRPERVWIVFGLVRLVAVFLVSQVPVDWIQLRC